MSFATHTNQQILWLTAPLMDGVRHGFSTRPGGVSLPPWDSLDLGIGRGGHGAGYWYCAQVHRDGTGSRITGRVLHRHYTGRVSNDGELSIWDRLSIWVLTVALFPILFIPWLRQLIHPEPTMEEQFVEFMRSQMDCELME